MAKLIIYALLGGILPALLWLFFWLREDAKNPEPDSMLVKTFLGGAVAVILVLPVQKIIADHFPGMSPDTFFFWAISEELFKFLAAFFIALRSFDDNEPLDPLIYMITAALGFVALENALFIFNPILQKDLVGAVSTGGLRFIGASLLHVTSSATIGAGLALSFYKSKRSRFIYFLIAFALAVVFHTAFNLFLLSEQGSGTFFTFTGVWFMVVLLLLLFERVKSIAR